MKVTGFSFIKNAIKYDYPIVEAIRSILPICDDFVVAVGESSDATLELIQAINPEKIHIVQLPPDILAHLWNPVFFLKVRFSRGYSLALVRCSPKFLYLLYPTTGISGKVDLKSGFSAAF